MQAAGVNPETKRLIPMALFFGIKQEWPAAAATGLQYSHRIAARMGSVVLKRHIRLYHGLRKDRFMRIAPEGLSDFVGIGRTAGNDNLIAIALMQYELLQFMARSFGVIWRCELDSHLARLPRKRCRKPWRGLSASMVSTG